MNEVSNFKGQFNCADDAADAVLKVLHSHNLHANCEKMSRRFDYIAIDVFNDCERLVGWFYVSNFQSEYEFIFHSC